MRVTPLSAVVSVLSILWLFVAYGLGTVWGLIRLRHPSTNRDSMRLFSWGVRKISGLTVTTIGLENIPQRGAAVYAANHQGGLDLVTFGQDYPNRTVVVAKRELLLVPLLGTYFLATGNLLINRKRGEKSMAAIRRLAATMHKRELRIGFFPEGTRNRSFKGLLPFKKGAFILAIEAQVPIVPMVASSYAAIGTFETLTLRRGGHVKVTILPPISTQGMTLHDVDSLLERLRTQMLAALADD